MRGFVQRTFSQSNVILKKILQLRPSLASRIGEQNRGRDLRSYQCQAEGLSHSPEEIERRRSHTLDGRRVLNYVQQSMCSCSVPISCLFPVAGCIWAQLDPWAHHDCVLLTSIPFFFLVTVSRSIAFHLSILFGSVGSNHLFFWFLNMTTQ